MLLLLERHYWLYRQKTSMTSLYLTSKHTHPLKKTNYDPTCDCDISYSNILGEILLSQNKVLMTSEDLWINFFPVKLLIKNQI